MPPRVTKIGPVSNMQLLCSTQLGRNTEHKTTSSGELMMSTTLASMLHVRSRRVVLQHVVASIVTPMWMRTGVEVHCGKYLNLGLPYNPTSRIHAKTSWEAIHSKLASWAAFAWSPLSLPRQLELLRVRFSVPASAQRHSLTAYRDLAESRMSTNPVRCSRGKE